MNKNKVLRSIYEDLLKTGVLEDIMPDTSGDWEKDKKQFTKLSEENDNMIDQ